jgi:hypothetical protein
MLIHFSLQTWLLWTFLEWFVCSIPFPFIMCSKIFSWLLIFMSKDLRKSKRKDCFLLSSCLITEGEGCRAMVIGIGVYICIFVIHWFILYAYTVIVFIFRYYYDLHYHHLFLNYQNCWYLDYNNYHYSHCTHYCSDSNRIELSMG